MRNSRKDKERRLLKIVGFCLAASGLGYYMLFHVSTMLKPPLGNTVYIVAGCIFIAVSLLVLIVTLKNHFFPKKRRNRNRNIVFLEDELKKTKNDK